MLSLSLRAAISAASLHKLAISAPENPGVCFDRNSTTTVSSNFRFLRCTWNISLRSSKSGISTKIWRSKRPARINARSRISARLVAARIITPLLVPKPSISVSSWFKVFSRSSFEPWEILFPRARPIASISSIKIMLGAFSLACLNRSRTRLAPTPTNISTKSEPESEKNGTFASPATALASNVFPVPGGPTSNAPFGILAPKSVYFFGFLRKSTISFISIFASSNPATSLNVMFTVVSPSNSWARDFPILKIWPPGPPPGPLILRIMNIQTPIRSANGRIHIRNSPPQFLRVSLLKTTFSVGGISCWRRVTSFSKFCESKNWYV